MITDLHLENFRGFEDHRVPLRDRTIIVGVNNAGKSTVVEALRLVAVVTDRLLRGTSSLKKTPDWLEPPVGPVGLSPSVRGLTSDGLERTLFHRIRGSTGDHYGYLRQRLPGRCLRWAGLSGACDRATKQRRCNQFAGQPPQHSASPRSPPSLRLRHSYGTSRSRTDATIRRGEGTYLESQHFRNQLCRARRTKRYREFRRIAEESWPGLQITELEGHEDRPDDPIQLRVRDGGFVGEVSLMGHGLQMWLQIVWFLGTSTEQRHGRARRARRLHASRPPAPPVDLGQVQIRPTPHSDAFDRDHLGRQSAVDTRRRSPPSGIRVRCFPAWPPAGDGQPRGRPEHSG